MDTEQKLRHLKRLGLGPNNFKFFLSHTVADQTHEKEVWDLVGSLDLTAAEWQWMAYSTRIAGGFYKELYNATVAPGRLADERDEQGVDVEGGVKEVRLALRGVGPMA